MDITTDYESVILGSNPGRCTGFGQPVKWLMVALGTWRAHLAVNQTSWLWRFDSVCYHKEREFGFDPRMAGSIPGIRVAVGQVLAHLSFFNRP